MFWADSLGSNYIYSRLEEWSNLYGGFFKPCAYLSERAAKGDPLVRNLELVFVNHIKMREIYDTGSISIISMACISIHACGKCFFLKWFSKAAFENIRSCIIIL